jgi:hypothetical protein
MRIRGWVAVPLAALGCNDLTVRAISSYGGSPVAGVEARVDDGAWRKTGEDGRVSWVR